MTGNDWGYDAAQAACNIQGQDCIKRRRHSCWWLRSPNSNNSNNAARATPFGSVDYFDVDHNFGARPAFNLNLNSVLFTSATEGGKSSGACGADALTAVSTNTTSEWKLTLHDSSQDRFTAAAASGAVLEKDAGYTDWSVPIVYSGASAANANDYVSVILADSKDNALYYGNIANKSSASSETGQEVNIPAGLAAGNYKLYVFSEQINVDKMSDYASAFKTIALTVNTTPSEPIKTAIPTGKTLTYNGRSQTGVAAGTGFTLSGTTSAANAGSYQAKATLNEGYIWSDGTSELKTISWKINKAVNPLKMSPNTATVKYSKLKKKTQTLAITKVIKFTKDAKDKKNYTLSSAKKGKKSFKK